MKMRTDDGQDFEQGLKLVRELISPGKNQCAKPRNSTLSIYMYVLLWAYHSGKYFGEKESKKQGRSWL